MSNRRGYGDLLDERDALLRSLEDLERERAAGDLDPDAYDDLHATYVARTAAVLRALESVGEPSDAPVGLRRSFRQFLGRRRVRFFLGTVATICVVVVIGLVAVHLAGVRLPGEGETGGVVIPPRSQVTQDLAQASVLGSVGQVNQAIELYDAVLQSVPDQPEALTYRGWLERLAGRQAANPTLVERGDVDLARAAQVAPGYADARGLYGIALLEDGGPPDFSRALVEFRAFCQASGTAAVLAAQGRTMVEAFVSAHQAVPALLRPYEKVAQTAGSTGA